MRCFRELKKEEIQNLSLEELFYLSSKNENYVWKSECDYCLLALNCVRIKKNNRKIINETIQKISNLSS